MFLLAQTTIDAAGLTLAQLQICAAAGVATWIIPISTIALLRIARKGANAGSVL